MKIRANQQDWYSTQGASNLTIDGKPAGIAFVNETGSYCIANKPNTEIAWYVYDYKISKIIGEGRTIESALTMAAQKM